jgi:hypothetical protein
MPNDVFSMADMTMTQETGKCNHSPASARRCHKSKPFGCEATCVGHDIVSGSDINSTNHNAADGKKIVACIPNLNFQNLVRVPSVAANPHLSTDGVKREALKPRSSTLFRKMVSGNMASFAKTFGRLI